MKRLITSILLACLLVVAPSAHAATFSPSQINSLLGLLNAFNVPSSAVSTVASILGGTASDLPFVPGLVGFAPTVTRIVHIGHHVDRDPEPEEEVAETPDWVPEGALAFIDFKNGHYWVEGEGVVALEDIVESDLGWSADGFDPADVHAGVGYAHFVADGQPNFKLKGASLADALNGTVVLDLYNATQVPSAYLDLRDSDAWLTGWEIATVDDHLLISDFASGGGGEDVAVADANISDAQALVAFTAISAKLVASVNGRDTINITSPSTAGGTPAIVTYSPNYLLLSADPDQSTVLRSITIYPVQDDADLPTLTTPEWVPEGALVVADFQNRHYWVKDVGVVAVTDMFESDDIDGDTFYPDNIEAGTGYIATSDGGGMFKGPALDFALAGSTVVFDLYRPDNQANINYYVWDGNYETTFWQVDTHLGDLGIHSKPDLSDRITAAYATGSTGQTKVAATLTADRIAASANGGDVLAIPAPSTSSPVVRATFYGGSQNDGVIRSIILYPPQDDADLPALSAI